MSDWLSRLRNGLGRSSAKLAGSAGGLLAARKLDDQALAELEEALIAADLGVVSAAKLVKALAAKRFAKETKGSEALAALAEAAALILAPVAKPLAVSNANKPHVILVCGVNGSGKTTTAGKLAKLLGDEGRTVMLAACDTFRAAAVEQLCEWGRRAGCPVVMGEPSADAASVAFKALQRARKEGSDALLIDTAGRLHNKTDLMAELQKTIRALKKLDPSAPHDRLLVLDATIGQNAHNQVEIFKEMADISGLILTKLDGSAKGGVLIALAERFGLPVHAVGVGEAMDDLRPFEAKAFARSLLGLDALR